MSTGVPAHLSVTRAYNGYIAAHVIFSLERLGVFAELRRCPADLETLAKILGADPATLQALVDNAIGFGYLISSDDRLTLSEAGEEVFRLRGFFTWAVGGYADVFRQAGAIAANERVYGVDVLRDEAMVALGAAQADEELMAGTVDGVLAGTGFKVIADLGSGTSDRLCRAVASHPGTTGIGLDISAAATSIATRNVREAGLNDRIQVIQADVLDVIAKGAHRASLAQVDTVMSFFLLHDLLADPEARCSILSCMCRAFPAARTFLLADTVLRTRAPAKTGRELPVFSTGFELAHALMDVPLHTKESYEQMFREAGFRLVESVALGVPHSWLFVLSAA